MYIVHVHVSVKPEDLDAFMQATLQNAAASRLEPGCSRFDVAQQIEDPTKFVLVEVYHSPQGFEAHKETAHYATWRDTVVDMMAAPRTAAKFTSLSPSDADW